MTTTTDTKPKAGPSLQDRERYTALVTKTLAARRDVTPVAAAALGKALAAANPSSDHGQVLAAAVRALGAAPRKWPTDPAQEAVWWCAKRSTTPTAAAVADRLATIAARRKRNTTRWAEITRIVTEDGPRAAAHVAEVVRETETGPTWRIDDLGSASPQSW